MQSEGSVTGLQTRSYHLEVTPWCAGPDKYKYRRNSIRTGVRQGSSVVVAFSVVCLKRHRVMTVHCPFVAYT